MLSNINTTYFEHVQKHIRTVPSPENPKNTLKNLITNLKGQTLKIITTQNYPLNYAEKVNGAYVGKGAAFDFLHYIRDLTGFKYTLTVHDDNVLGNKTDGILGVLARGEADIATAFLPIIQSKNHLVDYSPVLDVGDWVVLMKRPLESATGSGLLAPFTVDVWILSLLSLILMGPVTLLFILLHKKLCPGEQQISDSLFSSTWFSYGALVRQGSVMFPTADSTRLVFATWWIFTTILTAFYTANLTAFLTLSLFTLPVAEPSDIGAKRYTWIAEKGNLIQEEHENVLKDALMGSTAKYLNGNKTEIIENQVKDMNFLYIEDKLIAEDLMYKDYLAKARDNLLQSERCIYVITTWPVIQCPRSFAYKKDFKYKPVFDHMIKELFESGVVKYKVRTHLPKASICPLNLKAIERQLRNTDFLLTYYVITTGFVMSLLSLLVELLLGTKYKSTELKQDVPKEPVKGGFLSLPPPYHTLFGVSSNYANGEKKMINGTDYWVVPSDRGRNELIPVRSPSALLFQYTH
ncbi:hypothetical protein FQA39_LY12530 [Lamprigera yunnana]|nr:hypothetical protein FQA39_LY12530 [Lamprigera yunnana]